MIYEEDFLNELDFQAISSYIEPLIKYLDNIRDDDDDITTIKCYNCKCSNKPIFFHQMPSVTRLADEVIDTKPFCTDCVPIKK